MIEITDKTKCCGCHACSNICPKKCIEMRADEEGFLYPYVNKNNCVNCELCVKVCPEINVKKEEIFEQDGYIIQIKDDEIRRESTAGGAFTAISKYVIKNNGVVFGVSMDENFFVQHEFVENEEELGKFRNSKYVQSSVGSDTFNKVKSFLKEGRLVCFSGTPCQIEGLKFFLREEYNNLITVDVVCRAVPSPLVFKKYIKYQNEKLGDKITDIKFRDKYFGYKYSTMNVTTKNQSINYHRGIESDQWLRAFFSEVCDRPSCHECSFRKRYRVSDFTIWDCFNVSRYSKKMDDDKGTTRILINSKKGREIFQEINDDINYLKVNSDYLVQGVKEMFESPKPNLIRKEFMDDLNRLSESELFEKYFPNNMKVKFERTLRISMYKTGVYKHVKRIVHYLKKKG